MNNLVAGYYVVARYSACKNFVCLSMLEIILLPQQTVTWRVQKRWQVQGC